MLLAKLVLNIDNLNTKDSYRFWGFLEITKSTPIIASKKTTRKNVVAPDIFSNPRTIMRSKMKMRRYNRPTILITNMPDSGVAGPVSTHGNKAGQRYVTACYHKTDKFLNTFVILVSRFSIE